MIRTLFFRFIRWALTLTAGFLLISYFVNDDPLSNIALVKKTVVVRNLVSGGTGVILDSSNTSSHVLTNRHVCEAIKYIGNVFDYNDKPHGIMGFKESESHDLCLITVAGSMGESTPVSSSPPRVLDEITVSGHPHLMPTTITRGLITGKLFAMVGSSFFDTNTISALIAPGSSGSAVYNNSGEIVGLVFAGQGDLGFGLIVPWEYIRFFLNEEIKTLQEQKQQSLEAPAETIIVKGPNRSPNVQFL